VIIIIGRAGGLHIPCTHCYHYLVFFLSRDDNNISLNYSTN
jgi:hypothetical protein